MIGLPGRGVEQQRRPFGKRLLARRDRGQQLVFDSDQPQGAVGGLLIHRGDRGDHVSDIAHLVERDDRLVADRDAVIGVGQLCRVGPGHHRSDAGECLGPARIDRQDARMRVRAAQHLGVKHPGNDDVKGIARRAGDLVGTIERGDRRAERRCGAVHHLVLMPAAAAAWTASMIIR